MKKIKLNKFTKVINRLIIGIFSFLMVITFIYSACAKNYIHNGMPPDTTMMSPKISNFEFSKLTVSSLILFLIFVIGIILYKFNSCFRSKIKYIFVEKRKITSLMFLILACVIQLVFVLNVHPSVNFDVGNIISAAQGSIPNCPARYSYFSQYPDVLFLLIIERKLAEISTNQLTFVLANLGMLYLSVILNVVCVRIINKEKLPIMMYIQAVWLLLFPMTIAPYTDVYILPFISLALVAYALLTKKTSSFATKATAAGLLASSIAEGYFFKPTAVILLIAILITLFLRLINKSWTKSFKKHVLIYGALFISVFGITFGVDHVIVNEQKIVPIDKNVATPPVRLMAMGMVGNGGYNREDAMGEIGVSTKQQIKTSDEKIKNRLKEKGLWGYTKFLVEKQANDTSDGTFGWLNEGYFLNEDVPNTKLGQFLSSYIYPNGKHLFDFKFLAQLCWVILIGIILFGLSDREEFSQTMRLAIIGLMIFLLMFEGGRTRYMIQFLPCFFVLASLCWSSTRDLFGHLFEKLHKKS